LFSWIPGHAGVENNEIADGLARKTVRVIHMERLSATSFITYSDACKLSASKKIMAKKVESRDCWKTQTPRTACSKAPPNIFAPLQTTFPGTQDGLNLISWRWSLPLPSDPVW